MKCGALVGQQMSEIALVGQVRQGSGLLSVYCCKLFFYNHGSPTQVCQSSQADEGMLEKSFDCFILPDCCTASIPDALHQRTSQSASSLVVQCSYIVIHRCPAAVRT